MFSRNRLVPRNLKATNADFRQIAHFVHFMAVYLLIPGVGKI